MSADAVSVERFKIMERKLYYGIMTPGMVLTWLFGIWMLADYAWESYGASGWLRAKLFLLILLVGYHVQCGRWLNDLKHDRNVHSHIFFRWVNEIPVLFLFAIVLLAVLKPF
jgi:putative membrane protein